MVEVVADRVVFLGRREKREEDFGEITEGDLVNADLSTDLEARVEDEVTF
jgi:hypothetical protein